MPPQLINDSSDFEKLMEAMSVLNKMRSLEDILESVGLANLPTAQKYGILFGICVFCLTLTAVMALLTLGGTFKRISEQSENNQPTVIDPINARLNRPLIMEDLLEKRFYARKLQEKLQNLKPPKSKDDHRAREYELNYIDAYRTCQDQPGGAILPGLPEARYEAYARSYASCGFYTTLSYRRSYARIYEALTCKNHKTEGKYSRLFEERPEDIVGRLVRLEPLDVARHKDALHEVTCGDAAAHGDSRAFNANEVWGFWSHGPFKSSDELAASPVFVRQEDEAAFCIVQIETDKVIGAILLSKDDPQNLKVQMDPPIVKPTTQGSAEQIEASFLLLDKLFALGYRRVQLSLDSQDAIGKKLPGRLGFTLEGMLLKDMIVKDANRDSLVYALLNSDWNKGARTALFKNLHGAKMQALDSRNIAKEEEKDEQKRVLKIQKDVETKADSNNDAGDDKKNK